MQIVEITESKVEKMSDYAEKMLKYGGKLMQCIEELSEGEGIGRREREREYDDDDDRYDEMGERGGSGRGGYGERSGYGERRGVRGTGRYSRYR